MSPAAEADADRVLNDVIKQLRSVATTRYEDPNALWIMTTDSEAIQKDLGGSLPISLEPRLGTLPGGTLNARTFVLDNGTTLVVVNSSLFSFCHEMSKIATATIAIEPKGDYIDIDYSKNTFDTGPRKDIDFLVRYSKALEDYANDRTIRGHAPAGQYDRRIVVEMVNDMETFIIGHEYGHVVMKHKSPIMLPIAKDPLAKEVLHSWEHEVAADLFGYDVLMRISDAKSKGEDEVESDLQGIATIAPIIFFRFEDIGDQAKFIVKFHAPPRDTGRRSQSNFEIHGHAV
jgi:hypothetical protein